MDLQGGPPTTVMLENPLRLHPASAVRLGEEEQPREDGDMESCKRPQPPRLPPKWAEGCPPSQQSLRGGPTWKQVLADVAS